MRKKKQDPLRVRVYSLASGRRQLLLSIADNGSAKYQALIQSAVDQTKEPATGWKAEKARQQAARAERARVAADLRRHCGLPAQWTRAAILADMRRLQREIAGEEKQNDQIRLAA